MAKPYSLDLRERVVAAVAAGESCRTVAERFAVSVSSAVKWAQRKRATGSAGPARMGGRRPFALAHARDWLLARLAEKPDITLRALMSELAARGVSVSYYAVWHFFAHEGVSFKKKPVRGRARPPRRRQAAGEMEAPPGEIRPRAPGLHR